MTRCPRPPASAASARFRCRRRQPSGHSAPALALPPGPPLPPRRPVSSPASAPPLAVLAVLAAVFLSSPRGTGSLVASGSGRTGVPGRGGLPPLVLASGWGGRPSGAALFLDFASGPVGCPVPPRPRPRLAAWRAVRGRFSAWGFFRGRRSGDVLGRRAVGSGIVPGPGVGGPWILAPEAGGRPSGAARPRLGPGASPRSGPRASGVGPRSPSARRAWGPPRRGGPGFGVGTAGAACLRWPDPPTSV